MKEEIEALLKQYKERRDFVIQCIDGVGLEEDQNIKDLLKAKLSCYRAFIKELEDILKLNIQ